MIEPQVAQPAQRGLPAQVARLLAATDGAPEPVSQAVAEHIALALDGFCAIHVAGAERAELRLAGLSHANESLEQRTSRAWTEAAELLDGQFRTELAAAGCGTYLPAKRGTAPQPRFDAVRRRLAELADVNCLVITPLMARGDLIGLLSVGRNKPAPPFADQDVDDVCDCAALLALGIVNSLLRQRLEHRLSEGTARLAESEARARAVLSTAVDAVISIDEKGTVVAFNEAAARCFGYRPDEVISHNVRMLMPRGYRGDHTRGLARYRKTGQSRIIGSIIEVAGLRKDGTTFPMELTVGEVKLDGTRRMFTAIARDISARKAIEAELAAQTAELDLIIEQFPFMIFVKDATDLRFVRLNAAGERVLGVTREDVIGKTDREVFPSGQADRLIAADRRVLETGQLSDVASERIHTAHGQLVLHTRRVPLFDAAGTAKYLLGISEEIREPDLRAARPSAAAGASATK